MTTQCAGTTSTPANARPAAGSVADGLGKAADDLVALARGAGRRPSRLAHALARRIMILPGAGAVAQDLHAICALAADRHPAGAALVRAMLATAPAGHRALRMVRQFRSARRLRASASAAASAGWLGRWQSLTAGVEGDPVADLRRRCDGLLTALVRSGNLAPVAQDDLVTLLTLEVDARGERLQSLADRIVTRGDERMAARLLHVAILDAGVDDLRDVIARIAAGDGRDAIIAPHNHFVRALGMRGRQLVGEALSCGEGLERLATVWEAIASPSPRVPDPESAFVRLWELSALPGTEPLMRRNPDPVVLAAVIVARGTGGAISLPLVPGAADVVASRPDLRLPHGVSIARDRLVVACDDAYRGSAPDLAPSLGWAQVEATEDDGDAADGRDLKRRVMLSLDSTAVTIAHLRNPKVSAIPGLVEDIVNRTRSLQVAEMIATQRPLNRGFANRGVPLALLRSPLNIPMNCLRKFVHVQCVSKMELRRLASRRTGVRREVAHEVAHYLKALG